MRHHTPPPPIDPSTDDLDFQVLDWYVPENDKAKQDLQRGQQWVPESHQPPEYTIYMFGTTGTGHSVCAKVTGFEPCFFVKPPSAWWDLPPATMRTRVAEVRERLLQGTYRNPFSHKEVPIIPRRLRGHLVYVKLVMRRDFWGFTNGREFPFLKIKVRSQALFNSLRRYWDIARQQDEARGREPFRLYESNIDPFLRFIHERNLAPCGWVQLPAGSYDLAEPGSSSGADEGAESPRRFDSDGEELPLPPAPDAGPSRAAYHATVPFDHVFPLDINKIAPLHVAAFDIECTSSHGDFPVAKKDYRKLAMDLVEMVRAGLSWTTADLAAWIVDAFAGEVALPGSRTACIHRLYAKDPVRPSKVRPLAEAAAAALTPILRHAAATLGTGGAPTGDASDASDDEDEPAAPGGRFELDTVMADILGCLGGLPELEGDPIIQIGLTLHLYGSDEIVDRHILTLGGCAPIENATVQSFRTEEELLLAFRELLDMIDPDILTGYNIFGFDMEYMWRRAEELGIADEFAVGLGRLRLRRCVGKDIMEQKLSSSALGDNFLRYFDMDGVVMIDMLKVMQRDHKLDSYRLDAVAQHFLGDQKDDLKPKEIFEHQRGTDEDRAVIARYCLQDCALVNRLIHKLKVLENNLGMGNVCSVPLSYLFMRGQGVKIFSLVAKECRKKQTLVPVLRSFRPELEDPTAADEPGYEGAIVLDPKEGIYLEDPITVLDYSSLYPSSMIARNLSHDCFVVDPAYRDVPGMEYITVEYDLYEGKGDAKRAVGKQSCTFAQLPNGEKGIIPSILQQLLAARKNTRKKIEYQRITLADGRVAIGLVSDKGDEIEVLNVDQADLGRGFGGHRARIPKAAIVSQEEAFHPFEQAVLDALQLAYKVTANSLYGQIGARTSPIYWKEIAASTTATGREMIMLAKGFAEREYGAEIVYGDSVASYTPCVVRANGLVQVVAIENIAELFGRGHWVPCREAGRQEKEACELSGVDAWTDEGWSPIYRVIRHRLAPQKRMMRIVAGAGVVDATDDHSLLREDGASIRPCDIGHGVRLLHEALPTAALAPPAPAAYLQPISIEPDSMLEAQALLLDTGIAPTFSVQAGRVSMGFGGDTMSAKMHGTVLAVWDIPYEGYVYDLTTSNHHFQAGIGSLIVHNTDEQNTRP